MSPSVVALAVSLCLSQSAAAPAPVEAVSTARTAAWVASAVGLLGASAAVSVVAGSRPHSWLVESSGRPVPLVTTAGFALGLGLNFAITHLLLPELVALGDSPTALGSAEAARAEAWKRSRWALLGAGVGLVGMTVGAGLEQAEFGSGQGLMLAGLLVVLVGAIVFDVLEATGAWQGYLASRRAP